MQPETELSIVLPAYREAENLQNLLPRLHKSLSSLGASYEIVVADTPTPKDHTPQVCQDLGARYIPRGPGECYGDAVRSGIAASRGRFVIFMDADGSHTPEFVSSLYQYATEYDVVIASRYMKGGATDNSIMLQAMSRALNITYSVVLGLPCKDVSNSYRLYNGDLLRSLKLTCENFDIVEEILVRMRMLRGELSFKEVPFHFREREHGETKRNLAAFVVTYVKTMVRLWSLGRSPSVPASPSPLLQPKGASRRNAA